MNAHPLRRLSAALALAACTTASAGLDIAGLSRDLDPCVDFYQFANRQWLESTPIPDDQSAWGTFAIIRERTDKQLQGVLETARRAPPAEGTAARKALDYYVSGMDLAAIDKAGLAPLETAFRHIASIRDAETLSTGLAALRRLGLPLGYSLTVVQDAKDSTRYLTHIGQAGLGLPDRDYYFNEDERSRRQREAYRKHIVRMLELAGEKPEDAARLGEEAYAFELALAAASMNAVERRDLDKTYNKMTVEQLALEAPGFPWKAHLAALGGAGILEVNVTQPAFTRAFARLATERSAARWQAYLRWHVLKDAASKLPAAFDDERFAFQETVLKGTKTPPSRHRRVVAIISGQYGTEPMGQALGELFVSRAFPSEAKARMVAMVGNIKAALGERIRALDWMTPQTKARALEKLAAMQTKLAYPDKWRDYSDARVGGERSFVENWLEANAYRHRRDLGRLGQPVDRTEWSTAPQIVNAFYNGRLNEIVFPAGILQPPFFDPQADDAVNYGGIGMVIGHEITHGFDDRGRRFDARGNLRDWWTEKDAQRYAERAGRVERQFSAYEGVEGVKVNGKLTLGENISDLGGLKIAYLGLQKALAGKPRAKIDGLTPEQRFFLSYAQSWRSRLRTEQERLYLATDSHSPARFRVLGPLSNLPEFARAFSCDPAKTLRAESERANIW